MAFTGKIVLVAGGTGGLGHAVSLAFLNADARVIVTYQIDSELDQLQRLAGKNASRINARKVDVTDEAAVHKLIKSVVAVDLTRW
jgi:NAD(P)-dependent dehydrogenase (short-subunit alcohol dehydrogenase family)